MSSLDSIQYTYNLINIQIPSTVQLVHVTCRQHQHMACFGQIYHKLVADTVRLPAFRRAVNMHLGREALKVGPADRKYLVRLGATSPKNSSERLITWHLAVKAMQTLKVADSIINAVAAVQQAQGDMSRLTMLPLPAHILAACSVPSTNPAQLQMFGPLPVTLDSSHCDQQPGKRYGLQSQYEHLAKLHPLPAQLKELKRWSTNPIQLNRLLKAHSERTWANTLKYIDLYLGYCRFLGEQQPTLQMFLSPDHICKYVSFKVDSQHSIYTINMFLAAAREVLMWWQQKPGGHHPSLEHAVQWLRNMTKQV